MDLNAYIEIKRKLLERFINDYLIEVKKRGICPGGLLDAMSYSLTAGGKRLRPILAIAAFEATGGHDENLILPSAAALEFIHTYSLIHDDLPSMDNDDLRRGKPTNHKVFGQATAILAGDALQADAFTLISNTPIHADRALKAIRELAKAIGSEGMVGGQKIDIDSEGKAINQDALFFLHRHKTGALITASVKIGGLMANCNNDELEALTNYGQNLGLAFQVVDDILNVTGSIQELGKATGSDAARGKNTFPALFGMEHSKKMAQTLIDAALTVLEQFSDKADPLREIAKYVLLRRN